MIVAIEKSAINADPRCSFIEALIGQTLNTTASAIPVFSFKSVDLTLLCEKFIADSKIGQQKRMLRKSRNSLATRFSLTLTKIIQSLAA